MSKAIVLFSGGLDSSTCLALAVKTHGSENVLALSLSYGQKHERELQSAEAVANYYGVERMEFDAKSIYERSSCTLLKGNKEIPEGSYKEQQGMTDGPVSTYVPFRNGLFLSMAAVIALEQKASIIYYGAHMDDAAGDAYPDCSKEFNEAMSKAVFIGTGGKVSVICPFINSNKADIVKKGLALKVPYALTWSCYKGGEKPCGKCGTCIDRMKAFEINGVKDPLWTN